MFDAEPARDFALHWIRVKVERAYRSILAVDDVEARREAIVCRLVYGTRALSLE